MGKSFLFIHLRTLRVLLVSWLGFWLKKASNEMFTVEQFSYLP